MPLGAERFTVKQPLGALAATTSYCIFTNDLGETVELEAAQFNQLAAITCATSGFYTFDVVEYTAAGTSGATVATLHYGTASAAGYVGNHVAFVAEDLTLDSTGLSLGDGLSWVVTATKSGTASDLSADAQIIIRFVKGMTSAA